MMLGFRVYLEKLITQSALGFRVQGLGQLGQVHRILLQELCSGYVNVLYKGRLTASM